MKRPILSRALATLLALPVLASATAPSASLPPPAPEDRLELTVEQCVDLGLTYSRSLYASLMDVLIARARAREVAAKKLPTLAFTASTTRLSDIPPFELTVELPSMPPMKFVLAGTILNSTTFKMTAQQPLFTGFALESASRAARLSAQAAKLTHDRDRAELVYGIRQAYWGLVQARELGRLIDENVGLVAAHLGDVQRLFEQGLAKNHDVMKVRVQLSQMKLTQLEAGNRVKLSSMGLCSLLGLSLDREVIPLSTATADGNDPPVAEDAAVARALADRPELKALSSRQQAAKEGVRLARSAYLPQVALVGNYTVANPNTRYQPVETRFRDDWDISVGLSWTLWNSRATAFQVQQAKLQVQQAEAARGQLVDAITLEVRQNLFDLLQAREKIKLAGESVQQAEENHRITRERFKAGLTTNSELLDAEVFLLQTKVSRTQAQIEYVLAVARLDKSMGKNRE